MPPGCYATGSTQQAQHAGSSHLQGAGIKTTGGILSSLELLILHYLDAEQDGLSHHKEIFFSPDIVFFFYQTGKKCTAPSWSLELIISFCLCLASILSTEQEALVQADIILRRQPLASDGKDILELMENLLH